MNRSFTARWRDGHAGSQPLVLMAGGLIVLGLLLALAQVCQESVQRGERARAEWRNAPSVR
jgi:hypothetical protein